MSAKGDKELSFSKGVQNFGNTCFITASLQAMTTFQEFLAIPMENRLNVALGQALLDLNHSNAVAL